MVVYNFYIQLKLYNTTKKNYVFYFCLEITKQNRQNMWNYNF